MKEHNYALQKADKPRLRGSTHNICSVISISAAILKLTTDQNHIHFRLIQVLKNGMALHFVTFRSLSSKLEFSIYVVVNFFISVNFYFSIVLGYGNVC